MSNLSDAIELGNGDLTDKTLDKLVGALCILQYEIGWQDHGADDKDTYGLINAAYSIASELRHRDTATSPQPPPITSAHNPAVTLTQLPTQYITSGQIRRLGAALAEAERGSKIAAIKIVREAMLVGLKEAKDWVEHWMAQDKGRAERNAVYDRARIEAAEVLRIGREWDHITDQQYEAMKADLNRRFDRLSDE